MYREEIIAIANSLSTNDLAELIDLLSDRMFVAVNDMQGQSDSVSLLSVKGAAPNGMLVQIETE
jgi:hypothetical protein